VVSSSRREMDSRALFGGEPKGKPQWRNQQPKRVHRNPAQGRAPRHRRSRARGRAAARKSPASHLRRSRGSEPGHSLNSIAASSEEARQMPGFFRAFPHRPSRVFSWRPQSVFRRKSAPDLIGGGQPGLDPGRRLKTRRTNESADPMDLGLARDPSQRTKSGTPGLRTWNGSGPPDPVPIR
jgi:hypothetical protein